MRSTWSTNPVAGPAAGSPSRPATPPDEALLRELGAVRAYAPGTASDTGRVLDGGGPALIPELPERGAERYPDDPAAAAVFERLRLRSAMVVPVRARGRVLGALTLLTQHPYGRRYGPRDVHLAADLAGRAGLAVDNARLYEVEHAAALTLQRTLLPVVPEVAGLQIATRYLVGVDGNQVGGDWYDVLPLPDGAVGIAVGDVVGHDLRAAAAMGQLRGVVRSYAWDGDQPGVGARPLRPARTGAGDGRDGHGRLRTARPAGSRRHPHAALRQRRAPDAAAVDERQPRAARRPPLAHDRGHAHSRAAPPAAGPRACGARRARCCCSTRTA